MQKWWQNKIEQAGGNYILLVGKKEVESFVYGLQGKK